MYLPATEPAATTVRLVLVGEMIPSPGASSPGGMRWLKGRFETWGLGGSAGSTLKNAFARALIGPTLSTRRIFFCVFGAAHQIGSLMGAHGYLVLFLDLALGPSA